MGGRGNDSMTILDLLFDKGIYIRVHRTNPLIDCIKGYLQHRPAANIKHTAMQGQRNVLSIGLANYRGSVGAILKLGPSLKGRKCISCILESFGGLFWLCV